MDSRDPDELVNQALTEQERVSKIARDALQWFLADENCGEVYPRDELVSQLSGDLGASRRTTSLVITALVEDIVDPVQQISPSHGRFVGVFEYKTFPESGAYGYIHYDDVKGKVKRVVCAKCVEEGETDSEIKHAQQGEGTSDPDATWEQLLNKVTSHYVDSHDEAPDEIEPGASLLSGTTIAGNTSVHGGNQSSFNLEDFGSAGASDEVPIAQGDGTVGLGVVSAGDENAIDQLSTTRQDGSYKANNEEHVVSDQGTIELPNATSDGLVVISRYNQYSPTVTTASGETIDGDAQAKLRTDGIAVFVSNGSDWYATDAPDVRFDDKVWLDTKVANNDSTIDFIEVFDKEDQYHRYVIFADNITTDVRNNVSLRVSSDGGSTFNSGSGDYAHASFEVLEDGSTNTYGSGSSTEVNRLFRTEDGTDNPIDGISGQIQLSNPNSNKSTVVSALSVSYGEGFTLPFGTDIAGGIRLNNGIHDSVRLFLASGGLFTDGIFSVYGVTR